MLDPDLVIEAVVTCLRSNTALMDELGAYVDGIAPEDAVRAHFFLAGEERSLIRTLATMTSPSILIAYLDLLGGNFSGDVVWKHRLECYVRSRNTATDPRTGRTSASAQHLWWMAMNLPVTSPAAKNIRTVELCDGWLQLMETPTMVHRNDEIGQDFFVGNMVFPEKGDPSPSDYAPSGLPPTKTDVSP